MEWARLRVYDLTGRLLFEDKESATGSDFTFEWNGRDRRGDELANGVYLYRIEAGQGSVSANSDMGRIVIMR